MNLTKKISITILDELMLSKAVDEKNYRKALYGFEIIISIFFQTVGLVILGVFMGIIDKMILVSMSFALLRLFAGGYHADTCFKCFMMTFIMCIIGIELAKFVSSNITVMIAMSVSSFVIVVKFAPKDTSHKRMTEKDKKINKKRSISVLLLLTFIVLSLHGYSSIDNVYPALIITGLFLEAFTLLIKTN